MNLYELNQAGYSSLPKMSKSQIDVAKDKIAEWLIDYAHTSQNSYFMLLNNRGTTHYYTLFNWKSGSDNSCINVANEIVDVAKSLGTLKSIELNDNDAWEFWITLPNTSTEVYFLFNYDQGVIEL